jgi:hypothetical protein
MLDVYSKADWIGYKKSIPSRVLILILSLDSGINSTKIDPQVSISIPTLNHCDEGFGYLLRLLFWSPQVQLLIVVVGKGLRIKRHEKIDHTIFINW